jgi:hypothetical protein
MQGLTLLPALPAGGESALVTVAPILVSPSGLEFSALGFTNMLNGGGAVQAVRWLSGSQGAAEHGPAAESLWGAVVGGNGGSVPAALRSGAGALMGCESASLAEALALAGAGSGAEVAVHLRGCGSFLAYCSRAPERCWLYDSAASAGGHATGANVSGSGASGSLASGSQASSMGSGSGSGGEEDGEAEGPCGGAPVDFKYHEGQLVVEVPWREGSSGQILMLAFAPA